MYKTLLFDLDGTLTDPYLGITNSVLYALERFGITGQSREQLKAFIGPPLIHSFMHFYGMSEGDARRAVALYREYYVERGMLENSVYAGIPEALAALRAAGYTLQVATSKPEVFAEEILRHFDLAKYFARIAGASLDETRVNKGDVIAYALAGGYEGRALMIGDREHDVIGARENGLDCMGVLYGFGSREELLAAGAVSLAPTPQDIPLLLK